MVELNPETKTLVEIIGKQNGAAFGGISDIVTALVSSRAILPRQGFAIMLGMSDRADSPKVSTLLRGKAARLMTQRPLKRRSLRRP